MRRSAALLALLVFALPVSARASFHAISISELGAGFLGDPQVQFVELRLDAAEQTALANTRLTAFDKDGIATELLLTGAGVADGTAGRNVLYATAAFQTATGVAPDFVIPAGIVGPAGMLCWGAPGTGTPPDPGDWQLDKPNNYVDCVAYGAYTWPTRLASGLPTALGPGDGTRSLTRTKNDSAAGSNDTDFALATAAPCNNAGQCAALAPTPMPTPGKAAAACRRALVKAAAKLAALAVQAHVGCETSRLKGKVPACPDPKADAKIAAGAQKLGATVARAYKGLAPTDAGFTAACPGYTGACTTPIASLADVAGCVACGAARAAEELRTSLFAAPPDAALLRCQLAFGKTTTAFFRGAAALLARCEEAVVRGKVVPPCPDAKTAARLAAKHTKLRAALCKACGGKDKRCDGVDDAAPAALGLTSCPFRTVPGGAACGAIAIADLGGALECAACLADFASRCAVAIAVPGGMSSECSFGP